MININDYIVSKSELDMESRRRMYIVCMRVRDEFERLHEIKMKRIIDEHFNKQDEEDE